ncbi:MAG: DUF58 domain-containing protein [Armatimonadetes bacterium]|nr:DUF58 domain-containing protein [Armatimonadota bacterium]
MTRRGKLFLVATVILYLAGTTNDSQPAYTYASALLGILLGAYVLSRLSASGLRLRLKHVPAVVQALQSVALGVEVINDALLPKRRARLAGKLRAVSFEGPADEIRLRLPTVPRGATAAVNLPLQLPWRGLWHLEDLRLEGSDPLGIYQRPEKSVGTVAIVATPAYWPRLPAPWTALLTPQARLRVAALRPDLGEYHSLREYQPGDDLRRVHWRATAHRSKLMIKEFEQPRDLQVQVWLAPCSEEDKVDPMAELAISVAATIAHIFLAGGIATTVRAVGLPPAAQGPSRGELFWRELLIALGSLRYAAPDKVAASVGHWARNLPSGASVYMVSNDSMALTAMHQSLDGFANPSALYTGPEEKAPAVALSVASFDENPEVLMGIGRGPRG